MKEKLIIKNFGPIKDVELELGRFTVLIGEQATGKSTIMKLLSVCRYFSFIAETADYGPFNDSFWSGLMSWGLEDRVNPDSFIFYDCLDYSLVVEYREATFPVLDNEGNFLHEKTGSQFSPILTPKSLEFKNLLEELRKLRFRNSQAANNKFLIWSVPTSFYQNEVATVMNNPFYLPTERGLQSIFSLGKGTIPNLNDSLFNQLARLDQIARSFIDETSIEPLDVTYLNEGGKGYVSKSDEVAFHSLANGASGYQSAVPIVLAVKHYNGRMRLLKKKKSKTIIIEEPELNLFPNAQEKLVRYLVENSNQYIHTILITTHSPYILTSVNNLLYAFKVGAINQSETERIVEKKYWLDPLEFSIYKLNPDGTCKNIFDGEEEMILVEEIDKVSEKLNTEFDKLMDLEFVKT